MCGLSRTRELFLTAAPVAAERALAWGLVDRVVPAGDVVATAVALAEQIAGNAPLAVAGMRRALELLLPPVTDAALAEIAALIDRAWRSDDAAEARAAFLERKPLFRGKSACNGARSAVSFGYEARISSLLLVSLAAPAGAETLRDDPRDFSLTLPPRLANFPEAKTKPDIIYAYSRGAAEDGDFAVLIIEALRGRIGREPLDHAEVEKAASRNGTIPATFEYRKVKWKTFDLDMFVMHAMRDDRKVVTVSVQVPLEPQAIQLVIRDTSRSRSVSRRT